MASLLAAFGGIPATALAQAAYPTKAVRLVVNFPPGGVGDQLARVLSKQMPEALGQTFIVDNKSGGNGNIGAADVARAAPDGYTLLLSPSGVIAINGLLYRGLSFDPMAAFVPIASILSINSYLLVHPSVPVTSLKEFVQWEKARSGQLNYASTGSGSSSHLAAELLKREAGVNGVHVPYKGAAPALNGLLGGEVEYMFDPGPGLQQVRAGRLRMLAAAGLTRDPRFPDVPTVSEVIGKEFDVSATFGVLAPAGTPQAVIDVLDRAIARSMKTPEMTQMIDRLSASARYAGPTAYASQLKQIHQQMGLLIKQNNLQAD